MSSISEKFEIEYYRIQIGVWRLLGAMDLSNGNYLGWAMLLNVVVSMMVPLFLLSLFSFETPIENITNCMVTITSLSTTVKFVLYVHKLSKLTEMKEVIALLDGRVTGEEQVRYHQQMTRHLRRLSIMYVVAFLTILVYNAVSFLFASERSLPFPLWFPLDWKHSTPAYVGVVFLEEVCLFCQVLQNFADDSFPPLALYLIAEQCQLLILRISCIGYGLGTQKANEEELENCVKDQNNLYSLLELTRSLISWPMMIQLVVIAISIALSMSGLILYVGTQHDHLFHLLFLLGFTLQTYPLCYYGTMAVDSFADLHYAVFCSNWIYQSSGYRSSMLILSERTKRRQELFAGDIVPIHLSTFAAICKGSYSFFTLIQGLNKS